MKKKKLVIFSIADIRSWYPCYDPIKYLPKNWRGTVLDICEIKNIPPQDKLWCVCREELLDAGLLRRFAVAQAKTCRKQVRNKKEFDRILKVCLRFTKGKATPEELDAAESAAWSAAWSAARSAIESAAWSAAESAAESAARSAAKSAAWSAAWSAARSAIESAAWSAAESAAESAARSAAKSAAWSAAVRMLVKMIRKEYK